MVLLLISYQDILVIKLFIISLNSQKLILLPQFLNSSNSSTPSTAWSSSCAEITPSLFVSISPKSTLSSASDRLRPIRYAPMANQQKSSSPLLFLSMRSITRAAWASASALPILKIFPKPSTSSSSWIFPSLFLSRQQNQFISSILLWKVYSFIVANIHSVDFSRSVMLYFSKVQRRIFVCGRGWVSVKIWLWRIWEIEGRDQGLLWSIEVSSGASIPKLLFLLIILLTTSCSLPRILASSASPPSRPRKTSPQQYTSCLIGQVIASSELQTLPSLYTLGTFILGEFVQALQLKSISFTMQSSFLGISMMWPGWTFLWAMFWLCIMFRAEKSCFIMLRIEARLIYFMCLLPYSRENPLIFSKIRYTKFFSMKYSQILSTLGWSIAFKNSISCRQLNSLKLSTPTILHTRSILLVRWNTFLIALEGLRWRRVEKWQNLNTQPRLLLMN